MNQEDAIEKILKYLKSSSNENTNQDINFEKVHIINIDEFKCEVRELSWYEGLKIDFNSYTEINQLFLKNTEKEKREILNLALLKINDIPVKISDIKFDFIEKLWLKYEKYLHLSEEEIKYLYNSAKKYFSPEENEYFPLHPLVLEVDYMTKGIVSYSKKEFENLSIREFEAIQLILAAKNELSSNSY